MAVTPRPAATVMLVRDAPELEVFLLRRTPRASFVAGHYVFPGGGVDPQDADPELVARCVGLDDAAASALIGVERGGLAWWVAAVRESFEEAGVLLACDATGAPVDVADPRAAADLRAARRALQRRELAFADLVAARDLRLDAGALVPFSRWVTPEVSPRRFDTWFFVAAAPAGHDYRHDDGETVASEWLTPAAALARAAAGDLPIILPTELTLGALGAFAGTAELLAAARANVAHANGPGLGVVLPGDVPRSLFHPLDHGRDEGAA